jgi:hypothetical protein
MRRTVASAAAALIALAPAVVQPVDAFGPVKIPLDQFHLETVPCPPGTRSFGGYSKSVCITGSQTSPVSFMKP